MSKQKKYKRVETGKFYSVTVKRGKFLKKYMFDTTTMVFFIAENVSYNS